ncbi:hypothetical protein GY45DRAFT_1318856 [Cubamyces sp. BRFM 1775]|nr:hypothetical protein GY45DRAFT_1318856 [Cubamyces sp. BRFM 1775]
MHLGTWHMRPAGNAMEASSSTSLALRVPAGGLERSLVSARVRGNAGEQSPASVRLNTNADEGPIRASSTCKSSCAPASIVRGLKAISDARPPSSVLYHNCCICAHAEAGETFYQSVPRTSEAGRRLRVVSFHSRNVRGRIAIMGAVRGCSSGGAVDCPTGQR